MRELTFQKNTDFHSLHYMRFDPITNELCIAFVCPLMSPNQLYYIALILVQIDCEIYAITVCVFGMDSIQMILVFMSFKQPLQYYYIFHWLIIVFSPQYYYCG